MRIGLASDSHGNVDALSRALALFARAQVDQIFFLGGRCADVNAVLSRRVRRAAAPASGGDDGFLEAVRGALAGPGSADPLAGRIVKVASRACPEYGSAAAPAKHVDMVEGRICCLVHDKAELSRDDIANASLLFHGNSGQAALVRIGPRLFVTPGHLRASSDAPPSFALAEVTARELVFTVFSDQAVELRQERAPFAAGGKMSVK